MSENLQPSCNQVATDLISRQAAIEHLKKRLYETALNNITENFYYEEIADNRVDVWMNELPSAQPERNPGKTLAEEVERIKREITDIFAEQMGVQIEVTADECKQAQKDFADIRVGDTIYRQAAINAVEKESQTDGAYGYMDTKSIVDLLNDLPSAERKKGKWINNSPVTMKCDQCGYVIKDWRWNELNFCANCGADMRGEKNE